MQLIVEGMVSDLLHVIAVDDKAMLDRVLQDKDTFLALGLINHIGVFLDHAYHEALVSGATNDGRKLAGFSDDHAPVALFPGAVVNDESGDFFFL